MRKSAFILLLASVLSLASCNGKNKNQTHDTGTVSSVSLSESEKEVYLGKRSSDVTVTIAGEGEFNKTVKLSSDNPAIAEGSFTEVDSTETFKVYGKSLGETVIHVTSVQDETKAASLSVKVISKEVVVVSEILSVSLSRETKLFKLNENDPQPSEEITMTLNGRGSYDDSATIALSANPTVSVDKTELKNGEKFRVTAVSAGETTITVTSKQDTNKSATLVVRVDPYTPAVQPQTEVIQLDCVKHTLQEGDATPFRVTANAQGGNVTWSWKENDAETYVHLGDHDNSGATVTAVAATPDGKKATLVATLGSKVAECEFTVNERPKEFHTYYVSNNGYLNYEEVYFYAWNGAGGENAAWPGVKLENPVKNVLDEDCYPFTVDVLEFTDFKFNNGKEGTDPLFKETAEGVFAQFGANDNVWFDEEGVIHYAKLQRDVPTVDFGANKVFSIYNGESQTISFTSRKGTPLATVLTGADKVEVLSVGIGSISLKANAVGDSSVKVYIEDNEHNVLAEDTILVHVLDSTNVKTLYFSNNKGWENVYLYTWNTDNEHNAEWPGVKLENPVKNKEHEDVYVIHMDMSRWNWMIVNNGENQQTEDIDLSREEFSNVANNNIYPNSSSSPYEIAFAPFQALTLSVEFANDSVTVYQNLNVSVGVTASSSGVTYNITEGSDNVALASTSDTSITLKFKAAGSAKVVASLGDASDELTVTCVASDAPANNKTYYFWNSYTTWADFSLYLFNSSTGAAKDAWPGAALTGATSASATGHDCYAVVVDLNAYDSFILTGKEGEALKQSVDAHFVDYASDDMFSFDTEKEWINDGGTYKAQIASGEFGHTHSYDPTTHECSCGEIDPTAFVNCTFTVNYDTGNNGDLYIVGIDGWSDWRKMNWTDGNNWTLTLSLLKGREITFKFVVGRSSGDIWEGGENRTMTVPDADDTFTCSWQA